MADTYELFRKDMLISLCKVVENTELLTKVLGAIDSIANKYTISEKEKAMIPISQVTGEAVKAYLTMLRSEGKAKGTIGNKYYALTKFFRNVQKPLGDITANDIRAYLYVVADATTGTNAEKIREHISTFYKFCIEEEYVKSNPCEKVGKIKTEKAEIKPLSTDEMYRMRASANTPFEKALIEFMYSTGARIAEVAHIKVEDISLEKGEVYLFGKGLKHRTTFISVPCVYAIKEYLKVRDSDSPYLFVTKKQRGDVLSTATLRDYIHKIAGRTGMYINPHQIRHTTATNLQGTMPIQNISRYLGHENIATTMVYAQVDRKAMRTEFEKAMN